jgi:hypothetical protein
MAKPTSEKQLYRDNGYRDYNGGNDMTVKTTNVARRGGNRRCFRWSNPGNCRRSHPCRPGRQERRARSRRLRRRIWMEGPSTRTSPSVAITLPSSRTPLRRWQTTSLRPSARLNVRMARLFSVGHSWEALSSRRRASTKRSPGLSTSPHCRPMPVRRPGQQYEGFAPAQGIRHRNVEGRVLVS